MAQKWRFSVKFKGKECKYYSQYRSGTCPNRFPYNNRAHLRM